MKPRRCGDIGIWAVGEWTGPYRDPLEMYPDATPEIVQRHRHWLEPDCIVPETGMLIFAFQSYLIRTGRATILIDTCVGEDKERPDRPNWHRQKWPWLANLKAAGAAPDEIDFVFCTHLHVDHVGWNTRLENGRWVPTFPNATYLFGDTEYRHWEVASREVDFMRQVFADSVLPVVETGRATMVDKDFEIDAGLTIEPTPATRPAITASTSRKAAKRRCSAATSCTTRCKCRSPSSRPYSAATPGNRCAPGPPSSSATPTPTR